MKASLITTGCFLVAASAAAVGASTTPDLDGNNRVLSGSDIFVPVAKQILANTPGAVPGPTQPDSTGNSNDGTYYIGGGQSVGDAAIQANTQQISVGTASLKNSNYCEAAGTGTALGSIGWIDADGNSTTSGANPGNTTQAAGATSPTGRELAIQGTTEALLIGLDGLSILAHTTQAGAPNSLAVAGKTLIVRHYVETPAGSKNFVVDPNTDPTTAYGATNNGNHTYSYTFNNSLDVIRLLYGGLHHGTAAVTNTPGELGTFNCSSDVRRSLADSWGTLFAGAVPSPTAKLNRVWRRSDLAGATNAFIALVNFGVRGIGALTGSNTKTNPFCNSGDANGLNATTGAVVQAGGVDSTVKSNGGPGDFADFDPIRRPALVGKNPAVTATTNVDLEQVAANDGTLGLVLPVFPPDTAGIALSQQYPTRFCTAGAFALVTPGFTPTPPTGTAPCPQGGPFAGLCFLPYFLDTTVTPAKKSFNCIARSTNPPAFAAPTPSDNRVFNLAVKDDTDGHYIKDLNNRFLARAAWYRIHTTLSNTLVTPATTPASLVVAKQATADSQAAALVAADPFSVSFNGRGADTNPVFGGTISALGLSGQAPAYDASLAVLPGDQQVKNLVIPLANRPAGNTAVYPLARRIYVNSLVGFKARGAGNTFTPAADGGAPVWGLAGQELALARAFQNSDHVGAAFLNFGFVPLPSAAEGFAPNGVQALDYPEDGAVTSPNLTTTPLNGCGATTNRDATVASPPDSITHYSLNGSAPPFPTPWP